MFRRQFLALAAVAALAACGPMPHQKAKAVAPPAPPPATIILLHGAFVDGSGWAAVKADLEAKGDKVVVIELPGRASNPLPAAQATLDLYRDTVLKAVNAESAPVVLAGHSFGGMTISNVAEAAPEKIKTLVYVAAFLPKSGESLQTLAATDKDSALGPAFQVDQRNGVARIAMAQRAAVFCNDCSPEIAAAIPAQMLDEPLGPQATPVTLTARFSGVDRIYVRTGKDRAVSPQLQDRMIAATPVRETVSLDSGHLPMLTNPAELAMVLDAAARR